MAKPNSAPNGEGRVALNVDFVRDQAREAVHQFFRPITAPFRPEREGNSVSHAGRGQKGSTKSR
jgi:hypothetical protein